MGDCESKDLRQIKEYWEKEETISLKDKNLQELERLTILNNLKMLSANSLADIGCGDCSDTIYFCDYMKNVYGFDYSDVMLNKAKKIVNGKVKLSRFDLIKDEIDMKFDIVITKRCLINLGNTGNQKTGILKIHNILNEGGYYLMLESCKDGLNNLNNLRKRVGLGEIKEPFHNAYFELNKLMDYISELFQIERIANFSTYYFLTRVFNQILDPNEYVRFDAVAKNVHNSIDIFGSTHIGPQFLMVLRKK